METERELVGLLEAAKKAANDAVLDGASVNWAEVDRCVTCLDALKQLICFPVTRDVLVTTQVAEWLQDLMKHPVEHIQTIASDVADIWKKIVIDEATRKNNGDLDNKYSIKTKVTKAETVKVEEAHKARSTEVEKKVGILDTVTADKIEWSENVKFEKIPKVDKEVELSDMIKAEKVDCSKKVKVERRQREEKQASNMKKPSLGPHPYLKLTSKVTKAETVKVEEAHKARSTKVEKKVGILDTVRADKIEWSENVKFEKIPKVDKEVEISDMIKAEKVDCSEKVKVKKREREEKQASSMKKPSLGPHPHLKLTSLIKYNDAMRDQVRELLLEALSEVSREAEEGMKDEVNACDPIRVAVAVESLMFEKMDQSNWRQKYMSIMLNLLDPNNPYLRREVLLGHVKPEKLVNMTPEEMASDQRQCENKQIKENGLFECELGGPPKASNNPFRCGLCCQRKATCFQLQSRSGISLTTYVTCENCNRHWKFCE